MLGVLLVSPQISDEVSRAGKIPSGQIAKLPLLCPENHQVWVKNLKMKSSFTALLSFKPRSKGQ
jgi:hypothetical protein